MIPAVVRARWLARPALARRYPWDRLQPDIEWLSDYTGRLNRVSDLSPSCRPLSSEDEVWLARVQADVDLTPLVVRVGLRAGGGGANRLSQSRRRRESEAFIARLWPGSGVTPVMPLRATARPDFGAVSATRARSHAARALGEFGAVAVVSGRLVGKTQTATLVVDESFQNFDQATAYAVSVALALVAIVIPVVVNLMRPEVKT